MILTISNGSKDEEPGEMDAIVTICMCVTLYIVVLRCFSIMRNEHNLSIITRHAWK